MSTPCPSPEAWTRLSAGESPDEALLAHLASCSSCQDEVEALLKAERAPSALPKRAWPAWSWAAALLLAASWILLRERGEGPAPSPSAAPVPVREPDPLPRPGVAWRPGEPAYAVLGSSVSASLSRGGMVAWDPEGRLVLESGELALESPGEPVRLRIGSLKAELSEGRLVAGFLPEPSDHAWVASAWASEPGRPFVRVEEGKARVGDKEMSKGWEARLVPGGALEVVEAIPVPSGWTVLSGIADVVRESRAALPVPAGELRFEVLLRKGKGAECALAFQVGGEAYEVMLGSALPEGGGWVRAAVEIRSGWCRATAGEEVLVDCPVADLPKRAYPVRDPGWGLRAWGGNVELRGVRWRALR